MSGTLTKQEIREFKSAAQRLESTIHLGKAGVTPAFLSAVDLELKNHGLIKMKFAHFKEERKELAQEIATKTNAQVVTIVGHVAVFYRAKPPAADVN